MFTKGLLNANGNLILKDRDLSPPDGQSLWETCPFFAWLADPDVAFRLRDDFTDLNVSATNWALTQAGGVGAAALLASQDGGALALTAGSATAGQGGQLQKAQAAFRPVTNKGLWFEAKFQVTQLSGQFFVGLAAPGAGVLSGGVVASQNWVGLYSIGNTGALLFGMAQGGVAAAPLPAVTLTPSVFARVGFYCDGSTGVTLWASGASQGVLTTLAANLPTVPLTPTFVCQGNGAGAPELDVDWVDVFRVR